MSVVFRQVTGLNVLGVPPADTSPQRVGLLGATEEGIASCFHFAK